MPPPQTTDRQREQARLILATLPGAITHDKSAHPGSPAFVIHYALQQLRRDHADSSPPVAAIVLYDITNGAGRVFSIKAEAEKAAIDLMTVRDPEVMTRLEFSLLFNFNEFLTNNSNARFVHWYMRDEKFGFVALEERYRRVLADTNEHLFGTRSTAPANAYGYGQGPAPFPVRVPEERRVDLAAIIKAIHGGGPIGLRELADRNGLSHEELIPGEQEPGAFERGNHARLQWSTSIKTRLIAQILRLTLEGTLTVAPRQTQAGPRPIRVFVNYRREDTEAAAGRLHDKLSTMIGADNVFIDTDDIPAGLDFVEQLDRQIADCDVFLAMIGRRWASAIDSRGQLRLADEHDFVRREIRAALRRSIPVIPVLVDGTPMPSELELPADILPLRRRQAVELRNSQFTADTERLIIKINDTMRLQAERGSARR